MMLFLFSSLSFSNPDTYGWTYSDSSASSGPPFAILDVTSQYLLSITEDEYIEVELPFPWWWYDQFYESVTVSSNGVLFFEGETILPYHDCIGDDHSWSGIAAFWDDWGDVTVRYGEFGAYPYRAFAVEWSGDHVLGGYGAVQVWLMEGGGNRPEVAIVLDDITFGDSAIDGGAQALIGIQHDIQGTGVEWSCNATLNDISAAWFGRAGYRVSAADRQSEDLDIPWVGTENYQYLGRSLAQGDLDGDGLFDVAVGNQDSDRVYLIYGKHAWSGDNITQAEVEISGGQHFGSSLLISDLDGDGLDDLIVGAEKTNNNKGAVYVFFASDMTSNGLTELDASLSIHPSSTMGSAMLGSSLVTGDFDGDGILDLAMGAHKSNEQQANSGAVYIWSGAENNWSGVHTAEDAAVTFQASAYQDWVGYALSSADLNGDGFDELAIGAPLVDSISSNGGSVYLIEGALRSGSYDIESEALAELSGSYSDSKAGYALSLGDWNGDGAGDLAVGAPFVSGGYSQGGAAYIFWDIMSWSGLHEVTESDVEMEGVSSAAHFGEVFQSLDINGDAREDLLIAAPNANSQTAGGGSVSFFTNIDGGETSMLDADLLLHGSHSAGALGASMAVGGDVDGDGLLDLLVSAPYADTGYTMGGRLFRWYYGADFIDDDEDGFVPTSAGGLDCDDGDPDVFPSQVEDTSNLIDDDCDGWVDGLMMHRPQMDWWVYEAESQGMLSYDVYDFEDGISGSNASAAYVSSGLSMFGSSALEFSDGIFGAPSRGSRSVKVIDDGVDNELRLYFDDGVEAMGVYLLDGEGEFSISASYEGVYLFEDFTLELAADNVPSGRFVGLLFTSSVDFVSIQGDLSDGFGIDDLAVVWSSETDLDGDGYTEVDGDCDDENPDIHPGMSEDLNNGIDDDCDGAVDGGNITIYDDLGLWEADTQLTSTHIDFEDMTLAYPITDQYTQLGVDFDGALAAAQDIDGALPMDALGGEISGMTTTLTFQELQFALSFYAIDVAAELQVQGYANEVLLYSYPVSVYSEEGVGFVGLSFDYGVDTLVLTSSVALDIWGIDNVVFSALGLDDADGDGLTEADGDCDDNDPTISPDAEEVWYDGVDSNCDGANDYDADGDGHIPEAWGGTDCNDSAEEINPDAEETWYDGIDQNCDMWSDFDADFDGHESNTYTYGTGGTDCDDDNGSVNPDAEEVYYDETDDNCNPDDDYDADGDGYYGPGMSASSAFFGNYLGPDCDDEDSDINPDAEEVWYDGTDSNCDEESDFDADGDGYISDVYGGTDCDDSLELVYPGAAGEVWYDGIDQDCDGASDFDADGDGYEVVFSGGLDCDDDNPNINPDVVEIARDGIDQDCDGSLEFDDDQDGYDGVEDGGNDCDDADPDINPGQTEIWYDGIDQDCDSQSDYDADLDGYDAEDYGGDDCDDANNGIHPDAIDLYYDGIDNDCDGLSDFDYDGDGFAAYYYGGDDCNDNDILISPDALEIYYDGIDQNCDNLSDFDADGDGQDSTFYNGQDCDDTDPTIFNNAAEIAFDGIDQNCDGVDDVDADGDGFYYSNDCDDNNALIYPGAADACYDGIDADCMEDYDFDCDRDQIPAQAYGGNDCDDLNPYISPMQLEVYYDGIDQNCDGLSDYDADEDGYDSHMFGGMDCEDLFDSIHPGILIDDCGGGNEDCDLELDEDCVEEADEDTGSESSGSESSGSETSDSETADSGSSDDTSDEGEGENEPSIEDSGMGEPALEPSQEEQDDTDSGTESNSEEATSDDSGQEDEESEGSQNEQWQAPEVEGAKVREYEQVQCGCASEQAWFPLFWIAMLGLLRRRESGETLL